MNETLAKPETETSLYTGAIVAAVIGLLPYVNVFILPGYVIGARVAVWHASTRRGQPLQYKEGRSWDSSAHFLGLSSLS